MVLSFNGRVNIAVRLVQEQYPTAVLLEAQGSASNSGATKPEEIDQLKVVFTVLGDGGTVIIESKSYGEFYEPVYYPSPWLGDHIIKWPVEMDLNEAQRLKENAGYTEPYAFVTLRQPLYPGSIHPYFIFSTSGSYYVFVDTVTKEVTLGQ